MKNGGKNKSVAFIILFSVLLSENLKSLHSCDFKTSRQNHDMKQFLLRGEYLCSVTVRQGYTVWKVHKEGSLYNH